MQHNIGIILDKGRDPRSVTAGEAIEHTHLCGVEIELAGIHGYPRLLYWDTKTDGSIRGRGAVELTFAVPLGGVDIERALEELAKFLDTQPSAETNFSCSVHVHLDARDLTPHEVSRLVVCYLVFERGLYRLAGAGRDTSPFCAPLYSINNFVYDVASDPDGDWVTRTNNFGRYAGLNLAALGRFGSLEFRHMEGTLDTQRITEWINVIGSLKTYARQGGDCYEILLRTSSNYAELCESIFGKRAQLFMYPGAEADALKGSRVAQDFLYLYRAQMSSYLHNDEDNAVRGSWCSPEASGYTVVTKYQRTPAKGKVVPTQNAAARRGEDADDIQIERVMERVFQDVVRRDAVLTEANAAGFAIYQEGE
jgi:hypothetical protein